jgi:hypothetical protein
MNQTTADKITFELRKILCNFPIGDYTFRKITDYINSLVSEPVCYEKGGGLLSPDAYVKPVEINRGGGRAPDKVVHHIVKFDPYIRDDYATGGSGEPVEDEVQCSTCSGKWSDATDNEIALRKFNEYQEYRDKWIDHARAIYPKRWEYELLKYRNWLQQENK